MSGAASTVAGGTDNGQAENLAQDMSDLMHDFDVVSRIASLIGTLKGKYEVHIHFIVRSALGAQSYIGFYTYG